jgi:CheY-like chemotaxis protein
VRDTGTGMSDEVKSHLFEPFFTTKPVGKGTGMGLASVEGTVGSHGGTIRVDSELGHGTTVSIDLPIGEPQPVRSENGTARRPARTETSLRILVVDDELPVGNLLLRSLEAAGHRVTLVASGEEALRCYASAQQEIDLVMLDVVMPGLGGAETFRRLRALRADVKVLLCSGFGADGAADALIEAGASGLLPKPFEQKQLLAAIAATMGW